MKPSEDGLNIKQEEKKTEGSRGKLHKEKEYQDEQGEMSFAGNT